MPKWIAAIVALCVMTAAGRAWPDEPAPLLLQLGIEKHNRKKVTQLYHATVKLEDLERGVGYFVAQTDRRLRAHATAQGHSAQSIANLAGAAMEYSLLVALLQRGKRPLYWQAEFESLPSNFYDVVLFSREHGPVVLSPKTSLRERYKQADLEARALRALFPQCRFYLVTLDANKKHIANVRRKITVGELRGLSGLYDETNLDELFQQLEALTMQPAPPAVLRRSRQIVGERTP